MLKRSASGCLNCRTTLGNCRKLSASIRNDRKGSAVREPMQGVAVSKYCWKMGRASFQQISLCARIAPQYYLASPDRPLFYLVVLLRCAAVGWLKPTTEPRDGSLCLYRLVVVAGVASCLMGQPGERQRGGAGSLRAFRDASANKHTSTKIVTRQLRRPTSHALS